MSIPTYAAYKNSGVEWLGTIPADWVVNPIKAIARVVNGYPFDAGLFDQSEGFPLVRIRDLNQTVSDTRYKGEFVKEAAIDSNDVLIGMDGDFNVGRWRGEVPALLNQRLCCVRTESSTMTRYLEYVLPTPLKAINDITYSTTVKHLSSFDVLKVRVATPQADAEVAEIVWFLDHETAKIDALIEEQRRLIQLLKEKRQTVISHAVTKGLNSNASMKDSGVKWLGQVPKHWMSARLKDLFRQTKRQGYEQHEVLSVYRDFGVIKKDSRTDNHNKTPEDLSSYQLVEAGDLVINKMKAWQGSLGISALNGITSPDYVVFSPLHKEYSSYIHLLLRSQVMVSTYLSISNGIRLAQWRVEPESFLSQSVFLPPLDEQLAITVSLEREMNKMTALISEANVGILLLQERRTALISAAVTGKIDVRGFVASKSPELLEAA